MHEEVSTSIQGHRSFHNFGTSAQYLLHETFLAPEIVKLPPNFFLIVGPWCYLKITNGLLFLITTKKHTGWDKNSYTVINYILYTYFWSTMYINKCHTFIHKLHYFFIHISGIVHIYRIKNKDVIKMNVIAHFHMRLDFNFSRPKDFKCLNFELV